MNPCFDTTRLREVLSKGQFADSADTLRAMGHFVQPCPVCWQHLSTLAEEDFEVDIEVLQRHALASIDEPPVALAMGRQILVANQPEAAGLLPATHRYLLRRASWSQSFDFWWLLVEESRFLALSTGMGDGQPGRWQPLAETVLLHSPGSTDLQLEILLLIRAYEAEALCIEFGPQAVTRVLAEFLDQADHCRPDIRATLYEAQAYLYQMLLAPAPALEYLQRAQRCLKDGPSKIPGRLAETQKRIAMTQRRQGESKTIYGALVKSLESMEEDPRLRLELLLYLASASCAQGDFDQVRILLSQAEPLCRVHDMPSKMVAQKDRLWRQAEDDNPEETEHYLLQAFLRLWQVHNTVGMAQVRSEIVQLHIRNRNTAGFERMLHRFVEALQPPEVGPRLADEIEQILEGARGIGFNASQLSAFQVSLRHPSIVE